LARDATKFARRDRHWCIVDIRPRRSANSDRQFWFPEILPGRTQTAPLYIFAKFNEGQIEAANAIAIVLALLSFVIFSVLFFARDWLEFEAQDV
jgi:hypothetical protein